jgi:hypothetical protein
MESPMQIIRTGSAALSGTSRNNISMREQQIGFMGRWLSLVGKQVV